MNDLLAEVDSPIVCSYKQLFGQFERVKNVEIKLPQLPTIVVVGDKGAGKSSVVESLTGISFLRDPRISSGATMTMRLENSEDKENTFKVELDGEDIKSEENTVEALFTTKGVRTVKLTVRKLGNPDLTIVDLPPIPTAEEINEYLSKEDNLILHVFSATADLGESKSIKILQGLDAAGRTLVVVTHADQSPEDLMEKIFSTVDNIDVGLGCVFIRNRVAHESLLVALDREGMLFDSHHLLSKLSKSIVGTSVLAHKLVQFHATFLVTFLCNVVSNIDAEVFSIIEKLSELQYPISEAEAMKVFMQLTGSVKQSLSNRLLTAEVVEFCNRIQCCDDDKPCNFLVDEIACLEATKSIELPNVVSSSAFRILHQERLNKTRAASLVIMDEIWSKVEDILMNVLMEHSSRYPHLRYLARKAAKNVLDLKKQKSKDWVADIFEMEMFSNYTSSAQYMVIYEKLKCREDDLMEAVTDQSRSTKMYIDEIGDIDVGHLRECIKGQVLEAFNLKMELVAYWRVVSARLVDSMVLHLACGIHKLLNKELECEIIDESAAGEKGFKRIFESPIIFEKLKWLNTNVELKSESKKVILEVIGNIMTLSKGK